MSAQAQAAAALERPRGRLVARAWAAPVVDLDAARAALPGDAGFLWDPPEGAAWCGAGVAERIEARGDDRFAAIVAAAERLWARVEVAPGAPTPRLFGGFAFAPGAADAAPWAELGDASFVLPRWSYVRDEGRAFLLSVAPEGEAAAEAARVRAALERAAPPSTALPAPGILARAGDDEATWARRVGEALDVLAAGRVEKLVAARREELRFADELDAAAVLARLGAEAAGAWRFAFARGRVTFLGATPERLVRRAGLAVASEALAGTVAAGAGGRAELLGSAKDRAEHDPVVRSIAGALAPLCDELVVPAKPVARELPHVVHLSTPVNGRLRAPVHVVALAAALHPTPAVAGLPRAAAQAWIAAHEAAPRGWYAGPVGWFDAAGDGELVVALRSGLLAGSAAYLWAGAGLVTGSRADREWAETELKLRTLGRALGARG